jgi:sulfonate transport system substrate-binding protein
MPGQRRSRVVRHIALLGAALLAIGALAACGASGGGSSDASVLNVGQLGATKINEALLKASGEDKSMKYKISWSLYPAGGPAFLEAVPSGSVDIASMADTPPIFGQVAGTKTKIVAVSTTTPADQSMVNILVPKDSPAQSMADLKGKKVAILQGTILQYTVLRALEKAGLSYSDITPVNLTPPDAATAFQKGQVDAIAALDPQLSQLTAAGARVIGDGVGITAGYTIDVAAQAALDNKAKRADIEDFIVRLAKAQIWGQTHLDQWLPIYTKVSGLPEPVAKAVLARQHVAYLPIDAAVIAKQQEQADAYTQLGLIRSRLDVSSEFDNSFNDLVTKAGS